MPTSGDEPCRTARPWAAAALDGRLPQGAALDPDDAADRVGDGGAHLGGADDDDVVEAAGRERAGVVAGALRGDPQAVLGRGADDGGHLGGRAREGDGGGALVDGDVPRQAGRVVPGVAGQVHAAGEDAPEGGGGRGRDLNGHDGGCSFGWFISRCLIGGATVPPGALGGDFESTWSRGRLDPRGDGPQRGRRGGGRSLCCRRGGGSPRTRRGDVARGPGGPRARPSNGPWWPRSRSRAAGRSRWMPSSTCSGSSTHRRASRRRCRPTSPSCAGCSSPSGSVARRRPCSSRWPPATRSGSRTRPWTPSASSGP